MPTGKTFNLINGQQNLHFQHFLRNAKPPRKVGQNMTKNWTRNVKITNLNPTNQVRTYLQGARVAQQIERKENEIPNRFR